MIRKRFEELKHAGQLPTPSGVGLAILRITASEDYSLPELARAIQVDPALTGRILMLANSVLAGGLESATSVPDAALRLGSRAVRNVALGFTLVSSHRSGSCTTFDYDRFWSHSVACAAAAQARAARQGGIGPAEAFTCALLSRVGLLALVSVHPQAMSRLLGEMGATSADELLRAESSAFDIHHWEVSAAMIAQWGLPDAFHDAVLMLGLRAGDPHFDDPLTLALADILRHSSAVADELVQRLPEPAGTKRRYRPAMFQPVSPCALAEDEKYETCRSAAVEWKEWGRAFGLPTVSAQMLSTGSTGTRDLAATGREPAPRALASPGRGADRSERSAPSILVMIDEPAVMTQVASALSGEGYRVLTARSGEDGLRIVREQQPELVIVDEVLSGTSGRDLCAALRRAETSARTYNMLLVGDGDEPPVLEACSADVDDYVRKPVDARTLVERVQAGQQVIELEQGIEHERRTRVWQVPEVGLLTRRLRAAELTDAPTNLPNRRYALIRLQAEWTVSERLSRPLSIVMADIDRFQAIDTGYGRPTADLVLKATADVLRARTPRGDAVCRLDGDRFLVINVGGDPQAARVCAERLRTAVADNHFEVPGFQGRVTLSLGYAQREPGMANIDELLSCASEAMYRAKVAGRNRALPWAFRRPETG